jgi:hypothetical protein
MIGGARCVSSGVGLLRRRIAGIRLVQDHREKPNKQDAEREAGSHMTIHARQVLGRNSGATQHDVSLPIGRPAGELDKNLEKCGTDLPQRHKGTKKTEMQN